MFGSGSFFSSALSFLSHFVFAFLDIAQWKWIHKATAWIQRQHNEIAATLDKFLAKNVGPQENVLAAFQRNFSHELVHFAVGFTSKMCIQCSRTVHKCVYYFAVEAFWFWLNGFCVFVFSSATVCWRSKQFLPWSMAKCVFVTQFASILEQNKWF